MIIIDAGHGGNDPGVCANGIKEKNWTLEVSLYQYKRFQDLGVPVSITRSGDVTLKPNTRSSIVKTSGAEICISNHFNAGGGKGCEIIHSIFSKTHFANSVATEIEASGMPVRRVFSKSGQDGKDYYFMHRLTGKVKTIIVEYGFLDSESDFNRLHQKVNRLKYAEAVVKAICNWVNHPYKNEDGKQKHHASQPTKEFYYVQVGAYEKIEIAELLVKRLIEDGYPAMIK